MENKKCNQQMITEHEHHDTCKLLVNRLYGTRASHMTPAELLVNNRSRHHGLPIRINHGVPHTTNQPTSSTCNQSDLRWYEDTQRWNRTRPRSIPNSTSTIHRPNDQPSHT